jgi:hypothetical protein
MTLRTSIRGAIRGLISHGHPDERFGLTWKRAAEHLGYAGGELRLVRDTMNNMVRTGELERVARERVPGVRRPMTVYAPAERSAPSAAPALDAVLRGWTTMTTRG